jgi:hypothetical protein
MFIKTKSGKLFHYEAIKQEMIDIDDIAHALSNL